MFIRVDENNIYQAAIVHSITWKESHRAICSADFVEKHTIEYHKDYLLCKMAEGSYVFLLQIIDKPIGLVSVTGSLIADLYVLPEYQNRGYGTELLKFAQTQCTGTPVLWILDTNKGAERLYRRNGYVPTGRKNCLDESMKVYEFQLQLETRKE